MTELKQVVSFRLAKLKSRLGTELHLGRLVDDRLGSNVRGGGSRPPGNLLGIVAVHVDLHLAVEPEVQSLGLVLDLKSQTDHRRTDQLMAQKQQELDQLNNKSNVEVTASEDKPLKVTIDYNLT